MQFIQPLLLWSALAVSIPVVIHFWHQKRGKPLPWAATQWLTERDQQPSRGLRLDNIWLLLIRCLLLILLSLLLSQPILNGLNPGERIKKIHLVQPNALVTDNFRFELAEARRNGENVWWADETQSPVTGELDKQPSRPRFSPLRLQAAIDQVDRQNTELHLYLVNDQALADVPALLVPARFRLHTVVDSIGQPQAYLSVTNNRKLFVNRAGKLTNSAVPDPTRKFQTKPAHSGPIRVRLDYANGRERQTVRAALNALADVYNLDLLIDDSRVPNRLDDWLLTDRQPAQLAPQTLAIVSGTESFPTTDQVVFTHEVLTPQTSERVENGQLPEWLGEQLIRHYGLQTDRLPLSQVRLKALFVPSGKRDKPEQQASFQNALLLLFVSLIILERWLALTKNA